MCNYWLEDKIKSSTSSGESGEWQTVYKWTTWSHSSCLCSLPLNLDALLPPLFSHDFRETQISSWWLDFSFALSSQVTAASLWSDVLTVCTFTSSVNLSLCAYSRYLSGGSGPPVSLRSHQKGWWRCAARLYPRTDRLHSDAVVPAVTHRPGSKTHRICGVQPNILRRIFQRAFQYHRRFKWNQTKEWFSIYSGPDRVWAQCGVLLCSSICTLR